MSLRSPSVEDDYDTKIEEMDEDDDNDSETVKIPSESPGPSLAGDTSVAVSASASASASAPSAASEASASAPPGPPAKRPRGRPRKHPLPSPEAQARMARGRSKTGCVTCRRRKKKCLNCQKNAVVCEGYPDRVVWKSGRQKAEEARLARAGTQPRQLPSLIDGIENETDQFFLEHFAQHLSRVLTLYNDDKNPFREILLPTAVRHKGLMHSLLCLAGSHLVSAQSSNPGRYPEIPNADERRHYHFREACRTLREDKRIEESARNYTPEMVDDPTVAATLVLCLNSIVGGETEGQYRPHLDAAKVLVMSKRSSTSQFSEFLIEFFSFHDTLNTITTIDRRPLHLMDDLHLPPFMQPEAGALLGVFDGLFGYISSISKLRHDIRVRTNGGRNFSLDYQSIHTAIELDKGIRSWVSAQKEDSPRYIAAQLYRQCTWIYLFRSVHPSRPSDKLAEAVDEGLVFLRQLPPDAATQSILLLPLFLLGCAAFRPNQRPEIRRAFGTLKRYSSLGNIEVSRRVMEQVWAEMDSSQHRCWDWEGMLQRMGYDFIAT
ncbi:MAG: hypothetical protein M1838_005724 [Thelocarpon superellum]|nr:MAG: hypothetical protein M1838_005724 [Thelocarpon superellum]